VESGDSRAVPWSAVTISLSPDLGTCCARGAATAGGRQIGSGQADDHARRGVMSSLPILVWEPHVERVGNTDKRPLEALFMVRVCWA